MLTNSPFRFKFTLVIIFVSILGNCDIGWSWKLPKATLVSKRRLPPGRSSSHTSTIRTPWRARTPTAWDTVSPRRLCSARCSVSHRYFRLARKLLVRLEFQIKLEPLILTSPFLLLMQLNFLNLDWSLRLESHTSIFEDIFLGLTWTCTCT